jgi:hypothetical protein
MRVLLFLIVVVLVFALVGWLRFSRDGQDRASIHLETKEIQEDTGRALDSGAALLKDAQESVDQARSQDDAGPDRRSGPPAEEAVPGRSPVR